VIELVDPDDRTSALTVDGDTLRARSGRSYPIVNGIPRFAPADDADQSQTSESFGYKWNRQTDWGLKPENQAVVWSTWKDFFGWSGPADLKPLLEGTIMLEAGCSSGSAMKQFAEWPAELVAVDISNAIDACQKNFGGLPHVSFVQSDLNRLPFRDNVFDVVWSHGVLHHTPDTRESAAALVRHLKHGGLFICYIYRRKGPIREFVDDYLRDQWAPLPPADAWERAEALTELARSLAHLDTNVVIERDVPDLGITRGTFPIQRFVYQHVMKCFWNDGLSFDDNVNVNFDWYHPRYAHRHTVDEVRGWLPDLGLSEIALRESDSGISVVARKQ